MFGKACWKEPIFDEDDDDDDDDEDDDGGGGGHSTCRSNYKRVLWKEDSLVRLQVTKPCILRTESYL